MEMDKQLSEIAGNCEAFLQMHAVGKTRDLWAATPVAGEFSLCRDQLSADLYGMIDAVYILSTIGRLHLKTDRTSRRSWAKKILACQDEMGWFSHLNLAGHSSEHATAYAVSGLKLLEVESDEHYLDDIQALTVLLPLLTERTTFLRWIERLGLRFSLRDIGEKRLGWHYIWRGSHIGAGIAAIIGMTSHLFSKWWPGKVDTEQWFRWYFDWLDDHANPATGYWQRAFWNRLYRKPTISDMGGAVHFFWIYEALAHRFPYPEQVILSTLQLQRDSGLYKDDPFCIDFDGVFCVVRSFLQLSESKQEVYRERVYRSVEASFEGIVKALTEQSLEQMYLDSHRLPGALAALVECAKLPDFKYAQFLRGWQHPLDRVWWL